MPMYSQMLALAAHDAGERSAEHQRHQQGDADGGQEVGGVAARRHVRSGGQGEDVQRGRRGGGEGEGWRGRAVDREGQLATLKLPAVRGGGDQVRPPRGGE